MARREAVFEALDNAMANGYDLRHWSVERIVDDFAAYLDEPDLDGLSVDELRPHIEAWQAPHLSSGNPT